MKQASRFDGPSFDPFSLFQDRLTSTEVDIGRGEVLQAFVIAPVIVVLDESIDLLSQVAGQVIFFQQDAVLQGLVPALDLALGLRMIRRAAHVLHFLLFQPFGKLTRYVTGPVVAEQTRLV